MPKVRGQPPVHFWHWKQEDIFCPLNPSIFRRSSGAGLMDVSILSVIVILERLQLTNSTVVKVMPDYFNDGKIVEEIRQLTSIYIISRFTPAGDREFIPYYRYISLYFPGIITLWQL